MYFDDGPELLRARCREVCAWCSTVLGESEGHFDGQPEVLAASAAGADGAVIAVEIFGAVCRCPEPEGLVAGGGAAIRAGLPVLDAMGGVPLPRLAAKIRRPAL